MKPSIIPFIVPITIFMIPGTALAATIHVPGDHANIQDAIDAAANGDTVLVGPGSYVENLDFKGKALTVQSSHGTMSTVIDGKDAGSALTFQTSEGPGSVLDGFGIKNGLAANGGGICCQSASAVIEGNRILGNIALNLGGGIHCNASAGVISGNLLEGNGYGNSAGGISCVSGSSPLIANNVIDDNVSNLWCGGVLCQMNSAPTLTNNTFFDNYAKYGGAVNVEESTAVIANGILWNNAAQLAPGIFLGSAATVTISHSDAEGGQASCYVTSGSTRCIRGLVHWTAHAHHQSPAGDPLRRAGGLRGQPAAHADEALRTLPAGHDGLPAHQPLLHGGGLGS